MANYMSNVDAWRADAAEQYLLGQTSRAEGWRNVGLIGGGTTYDPSGLLSGPVTINSTTGGITFPLNASVNTGISALGAAYSILAIAPSGATLGSGWNRKLGFVKTWTSTSPDASEAIRFGIAVMAGQNPSVASGFAFGHQPTTSGGVTFTQCFTGSSGTWSSAGVASTGISATDNAVLGTAFNRTSGTTHIITARPLNSTGVPNNASTGIPQAIASSVNIGISTLYICVWIATTATSVAAGDREIFGLFAFPGASTTDSTGLGA